jgi:FkbM family methyltransferase
VTHKEDAPIFAPLRNTMEEALRHIAKLDFSPDVIVDIGVANGTGPLLKIFNNTRFLWIEPLHEFENDLKKLSLRFKGDYIITAAGRYNGKIKINVHSDLVGSSFLKESDGDIADGIEREVNIIKLDDLINKFELRKNILLKIDVQGAELDVLEGAQELIHNCEVIITEVSFFKFLKNGPEFYDIIYYLKTKGFVAYDIFDGHNRLLDDALAQKDIMFVKENGFFRKSDRWATDQQRIRRVNAFAKPLH